MNLLILIAILFFLFKRKGLKDTALVELFRQDQLSQILITLGVLFFGSAMYGFNQNLQQLLPWEMLLLIVVMIGFFVAYRLKVVYLLVLSLLGAGVWWWAEASTWLQPVQGKTMVIVTGLILISVLWYVVSRWHTQVKKYPGFSQVYLFFSFTSVTGVLFYFSLKSGVESVGQLTTGQTLLQVPAVLLLLLILLIATIGAISWGWQQQFLLRSEVWGLAILGVFSLILVCLPQQMVSLYPAGKWYQSFGKTDLTTIGIFWAVVFNLLTFGELLGLIWIGFLRRQEWLINISIVCLFLIILFKYVDWFFSFLDKSIFFIGVGVVFLLIGLLMERGRKYILANLKHD